MASLKTEHLCFRTRNHEILSDISLELGTGEYLGLIGPNGSGKSTLLRLIAGQIKPSSGSISINGRPFASMPVRERGRLISYMPQVVSSENLRTFTVRDVVMMGRFPYYDRLKGKTSEDFEKTDEAIEEMDLESMAGRDVTSLSGGEFQKVLLAGVIAQEAEILLLDESFSFLDIRHRIDLEIKLKSLLKKGRSIIYVFHQFDESLHTKTGLFALKDGKTFFHGSVDRFLEKGRPDRLFDIPFKKVSIGKRKLLLPDMPL